MAHLPANDSFVALLSANLNDLKHTADKRIYRAGQVIFNEGDAGDGVYIIEHGHVLFTTAISETESRTMSQLGPGTFFGEMSVLDGQPRSATATATTDTAVCFISRDGMMQALVKSPELLALLAREFSLRVRQFDRKFIEDVLQAERLALVGRFAQSIVHDFKNPLNIIGMAAELASVEGALPEERAEAKTQITRQVSRLTNMINELIEFTRGSARSVTLKPTSYRKFIRDFLKEVEPETAEKSVKLRCENEPPDIVVRLDGSRLLHVLYNLVNNAADMMPYGGAITLRFIVEDCEIVTEVEDSGPGLAPEIQSRLFQPFATHGKAHGTGLGLSICKRIIDDHHGHISARSEPGRGAIFAFTIPRPIEAAAGQAAWAESFG